MSIRKIPFLPGREYHVYNHGNVNRNLIEEEDYFLFLIRYIHSNPVKHDFTTNMLDWEHSSIHAYRSQQNTQLHREEVIRRFGGIEAFMEAHGLGINSNFI